MYINLFCGEVVGTVEKFVINGAFGVFVCVLLGEIYIIIDSVCRFVQFKLYFKERMNRKKLKTIHDTKAAMLQCKQLYYMINELIMT